MAKKTLSPRQFEVAEKVTQGRNRYEIANDLGIDPRTVADHQRVIYEKLGFARKPHPAVRLAVWFVRLMIKGEEE